MSKQETLANEKTAKKLLFADNPELINNPAMQDGIREYYVNRHGKSVEGLRQDMKDALNLYKINNNIPITETNTGQEEQHQTDVPSVPTGSTNNADIPEPNSELTSRDKEIKESYCREFNQELSDETFLKYKKEVLAGERSAPQEVVNLFKSSV